MPQLRFPRPRVLTPETLEQVHEAAVKILGTVGLRVRVPEALEAAARLGLKVREARVFFERPMIDAFVAETRAESGGPSEEREPEREIRLAPSQYPIAVHDLDTDAVVPATTERLIEGAKLLDTLHDRGVYGRTPGAPMDVSPDLQPILKQKIQALYCRDGKHQVELGTPRATPYLCDLAAALGDPITSIAVYVVSPLTLGGESLECVLTYPERFQYVWVSNMSSLGATAPIGLGEALALGAAEVIGSALLTREVLGLPVGWSVRVCPFDPRATALTLGAPEELPTAWASEELNAWYHGHEVGAPWGSLHTQAKLPDAQATAERLTILLMHSLFGARVFGGLGALSLDEIFSPEQVLIDLELRDHVQRLLDGMAAGCDPEACVAEVQEGIHGGFLGLERTAAEYRGLYWWPQLLFRGMIGEWRQAGQPELRARTKELVRRQLRRHEYELEPDLRREVERICAQAERDLA